jgi:pimeloyl-ACP methyl ester carboxylesterase
MPWFSLHSGRPVVLFIFIILLNFTYMKHLICYLLVSMICVDSMAQPDKFIGIWEGELNTGMQQLRMVFTFKEDTYGKMVLTIQAPQQSPMHIPTDTLYFPSPREVATEKKQFNMSFTGKLINDTTLEGNFVQGMNIPLQLKKVERATPVEKVKRPQTPRPPFPYKSTDITFLNKKASIQLAGTLSLPDTTQGKKYPALVLISGSGPQDRDETILGHKPFAVIADHFTRKGFAVLRYDDRGTSRSGGDHSIATSADFADDTRAAVDYLKGHSFIDQKKIGLIGHSEGGMIAPMVASVSKDIKWIILLAGPGIPCIDLLTEQNVAILSSSGINAAVSEAYGPMFKTLVTDIIFSKDSAEAVQKGITVLEGWKVADSVKAIFKVSNPSEREVFAKAMVDQLYSPWFKYFLSYDPAPVLQKLSCDVLALNGSRDIQVLTQSNLYGIKSALKKSRSKNYEVKEIDQLNHLFQTCRQCTLNEYGEIEESFSPVALEIMSDWLLKQVQ